MNETVGGFNVVHSESWASIPNVYQVGVPTVVTWHGSMLDWVRNEINQLVLNNRQQGAAPGHTATSRMKALAEAVAFETFALQYVPQHVVISDSARSDLVSAQLVPAERVHLVYNGVNERNFSPNRTSRAHFLRKFNISAESTDFVIACGGRLTAEKGHGQLSRAVRPLLKTHPDMLLIVAGTGAEQGHYQRMRERGLRVHLVGMLGQSDLAAFYNAADVFVDPYWQHHGLNTVMIEASLSGTPLLVSALPSSLTTVPSSAFGERFEIGNGADFREKLTRLYRRRDLRDQMGKNLRQRAKALFTSDIMAGQYESVLYHAVHKPVRVPALTGDVVCRETYPAMCYRLPEAELHPDDHHRDAASEHGQLTAASGSRRRDPDGSAAHEGDLDALAADAAGRT
eukprot:TRINITY_DN24129_c0_g1_i2.p1 TRINITY_DN24129_c0_g1~~TRINITY_DN24129_c0_g1_i2.p1  ORF type:complete len:399 (+),score=87.85 TRINITY_DN24129_c0_g1_i2:1257-2453(+)